MSILYQGPDISSHNGNVNIKMVRDAGYKRICIRAGYGNNNTDQKFNQNALACVNLGVPVLLYWFSYATNVDMAKKEADHVVNHAKKYWEKCPIAFDLEYDTVRYARTKGVNIDKNMATSMAIAFLKRIKELGFIPVLYTNKDYLKNYFDFGKIKSEVGEVYLWYAKYVNAISISEKNKADMWQFTSKGRIPGASGNIDLNEFYTNFETIPKHPEENDNCNINIMNFQKAANLDGYRDMNGNPLKEDGMDGLKTQYVRKQINLKAKKVGLVWKTGSRGHVVSWFQNRCNEILGHNQDVDNYYGPVARNECIELQHKFSLEEDGIGGYDSIQICFYN